MPTRNVVLNDHQEAVIGQLVDSGRFLNASEVMRHGLRLVEQTEAEQAARLMALRAHIDEAEADIAAGDFIEFEPGCLERLDPPA